MLCWSWKSCLHSVFVCIYLFWLVVVVVVWLHIVALYCSRFDVVEIIELDVMVDFDF